MAIGKTEKRANGGAHLAFEATLWQAADKLRGHVDASEYKHVVLGLIFLKYISDAFEEQHARLASLRDTLLPKLLSGEMQEKVNDL